MRALASRFVRIVFGLIIAGIFLVLTLRHVDLHRLITSISQIGIGSLTFALIFLAMAYGVRIIRWWCMVRACNESAPLSACAWPLLVGFGLNGVLPFRIGDAVRVLGFRDKLKTPIAQLVGTLFLERLLDLTVLLCFLLVRLGSSKLSEISAPSLRLAIFAAAGGILAWVFLIIWSAPLESVLLRICRQNVLVARGWSDKATQLVTLFFSSISTLRHPARVVQLFALSFLIWGCEGAIFSTVTNGIVHHGAGLAPWFALATGTLATLIPGPPGYIGTFEFFTVAGLMSYGVSRAQGAAIALVVHAILWLPPTVVGVCYLLVWKLTKGKTGFLPTSVGLRPIDGPDAG